LKIEVLIYVLSVKNEKPVKLGRKKVNMEKVVFLGTSAGMPTKKRNVPSCALIFNTTGEFWLFDCGEGTQQQIHNAGLKLSKLTNIFISHLHGDHLFGLPGLLATRGLLGIKKSINIFGPVGLDNYLKNNFDYSCTHIPYFYHIYAIEKESYLSKNLLWENGNISIYCALLNHYLDSFGYAIIEKNIKRNILVEKLVKMGIPPGPIYKKFKENGIINLNDGTVLKAVDFIKESISIKKLCYCGDTTFSSNAVILAQGADLLIHEGTFCSKRKQEANQSYHSTIEEAIKVARLARVKKLAITHLSPRYHDLKENTENFLELKKAALKKHPEVILAEDFLEIKI